MSRQGQRLGAYDITRPWHGVDTSWEDAAACQGDLPSETKRGFFADVPGRSVRDRLAVEAAKALCRSCPVQAECLGHALETEPQGVWGGATEAERRKMRRRPSAAQATQVPAAASG